MSPSPRPVIVFDYDGTLVDTYAMKRESYWRAVSEVLGLDGSAREIVDASYARTSGAHRLQQFADTLAAVGRQASGDAREDFSRRYSAYNDAAAEQMREFPSARPALETLRRRYDLVLCSGLPHDALVADARRRGLDSLFVRVEGGDKGKTLDTLAGEGREIVGLVGDTPHDRQVAASRGVPFFNVAADSDLRRLTEELMT